MASASQDEDRRLALAAVTKFVKSLNSPPPLTEARGCVFENGLEVLHRGEGIFQSTIGAAITRAEASHQSHRTEQSLVEPAPEIWVCDDLSAISSGYSIKVEDVEVFRGVSLFSLLKTAEGWKIAAVSDVLTFHGDRATLESGVAEDVIDFVQAFLKHINNQEWDSLSPLVLSGGGVCLSRRPNLPFIAVWPLFLERLKKLVAALPPGSEINETIHDVQVRRVGDFAFVWAPFDLSVNNKPVNRGMSIYTLLKRGDRWLISGLQDTSLPVCTVEVA